MRTSRISVLRTISITGVMDAIAATRTRGLRDMFHTTLSVTKTWMTTVTGTRIPVTAMCGTRTFPRDGLPTERAIGPGSIPGDGPGSMMSHGATRRFIMAAGCPSKDGGVGSQDRWKLRQGMPPPLWFLSAEAAGSLATT